MAKDNKQKYNADNIVKLDFPDTVRHNPQMYLGGNTNSQAIYEVVSNCVDEFLGDFCSEIYVKLNTKENTIVICDNGRGMPVDKHKATGESAIYLILASLHAGGKMKDNKAYKKGCFTGDTKIRLLNGKVKTLAWLEKHKKDETFWVISSKKDGTIVPGLARDPRVTKTVSELIEVTLDNGKKERCTLDHKWQLRDGTYCRAKDLTPGTSLMPFYFKRDVSNHLYFKANNPKQINLDETWSIKDGYLSMYHTVYSYFNGPKYRNKGQVLHHKDFDGKNDTPENLQCLPENKHRGLHMSRLNKANPEFTSVRLTKYNKSEKGRQTSSMVGTIFGMPAMQEKWVKTSANKKRVKKHWQSLNSTEDGIVSQQKCKIFRAYLYITKKLKLDFNEDTYNTYKMWGAPNWWAFEEHFGSIKKLKEELQNWLAVREHSGLTEASMLSKYKPIDRQRVAANYNNHKVVSTKIIKLKKPLKVYDITVDKYHNFALASGVFVHNSGGKHGVGVSCTNAVSEDLVVQTFKDGKWWTVSYHKGILKKKLAKMEPKSRFVKAFSTGTQVFYRPDESIHKKQVKIKKDEIQAMLEDLSYIAPKLLIHWDCDGKVKKYKQTLGGYQFVLDYFNSFEDKKIVKFNAKPYQFRCDNLDVSLLWTTGDEEEWFSYTNCIHNPENGVHADTVKDIINKTFKKVFNKTGYTNNALRQGLIGFVSIRMEGRPEYRGQTKDSLTSEEAIPIVEQMAKDFEQWVRNTTACDKIINFAIKRGKATQAMSKDLEEYTKELTKEVEQNNKKGRIYCAKLLDAIRCKPEEREVFLVEGDSAKNPVDTARDTSFQALLPLKGKFSNAFKDSPKNIFKNADVINIFSSLGMVPGSKTSPVRAKRVIVATDADYDGYHIACLIISLFARFRPDFIKNGGLYLVKTPLFALTDPKGNKQYAYNQEEMEKIRKTGKFNVVRFKGLGEADADVIKEFATNPETRNLIQVRLKKASIRKIEKIMGVEVEHRKKLLGIEPRAGEEEANEDSEG